MFLCVVNPNVFTEIKVLDRDMQTLVYDNYNKFISATDMIRKVRYFFLANISAATSSMA